MLVTFLLLRSKKETKVQKKLFGNANNINIPYLKKISVGWAHKLINLICLIKFFRPNPH